MSCNKNSAYFVICNMSFVSLLEYRNRPNLIRIVQSYCTIVYYDSNIIQIVQIVVTSSESFSSTKKYLHCPNCPNPRNFGITSWNYCFKLKFWNFTWVIQIEIQIEIQISCPNWNRLNLMQIKIESQQSTTIKYSKFQENAYSKNEFKIMDKVMT